MCAYEIESERTLLIYTYMVTKNYISKITILN